MPPLIGFKVTFLGFFVLYLYLIQRGRIEVRRSYPCSSRVVALWKPVGLTASSVDEEWLRTRFPWKATVSTIEYLPAVICRGIYDRSFSNCIPNHIESVQNAFMTGFFLSFFSGGLQERPSALVPKSPNGDADYPEMMFRLQTALLLALKTAVSVFGQATAAVDASGCKYKSGILEDCPMRWG
jgi:hypothetical protein